jgi:predicted sulfurtransferase
VEKGKTTTGRVRPSAIAGLVALCLVMLFSLACIANDIPGLNAKELKELLASGERVLVVDTRSESEYARGHVPNAILIPEEKASIADRLLPGDVDRDTAVVFYCRGGS